jgi:cytochrome c nitrite reductase small subunit
MIQSSSRAGAALMRGLRRAIKRDIARGFTRRFPRHTPRLPQAGLAGHPLLLVALALLIGAAAGLGATTFVRAKGLSYMSSDPAVCINCHIMQPQYDAWQKSSHHAVAGCVDCHLPHDFIGKWTAKALNGYHHSKAFTLQDFAEPIALKPGNARILQDSCLACHGDLVHQAVAGPGHAEQLPCVHCHQGVGHGERAGLGGPRS